MTNLNSLWANWIELHDSLAVDPKFHDKIAEPFVSVPPIVSPSILYVGKATSKDGPSTDTPLERSGYSVEERVAERRKCTVEFLGSSAPRYNGAFWHFAERLNVGAAQKWKPQNQHPLCHIGWSNLFKIGTTPQGNPRKPLREKQWTIALETLKVEIEVYRPALVYFVTGDYADDFLGELLGDPNHVQWNIDSDGANSRPQSSEFPAVLWTNHPQGAARDVLQKWLDKANDMLPA